MVSSKQLQANRSNAKHSTGPKTQSGKSRSKMNGLKHGLTAAEVVVLDEDPAEFEALRADAKAYFEPKGSFEHDLVDRIAVLLWRLRRIPLLEAALIRDEMEKVEAREARKSGRSFESLRARIEAMSARRHPAVEEKVDRADNDEAARAEPEKAASEQPGSREARRKRIDEVLASIAEKNTIGNLSQYEAGLMTGLSRTVALLHSCQAVRIQPSNSEHLN